MRYSSACSLFSRNFLSGSTLTSSKQTFAGSPSHLPMMKLHFTRCGLESWIPLIEFQRLKLMGNSIMNLVPLSSLSKIMVPSSASINRFTTAKPKP